MLSKIQNNTFPGGSKGRVNRAGENVKNRTFSEQDLAVIDEWRSAHRNVLNTFQALLRTKTRNSGITVAQRHKRRSTIFDKLNRLPGMQLARMDDIAGCRLIFNDINSLYSFRNNFHRAKFHHHLKNQIDKYDYIKEPKLTGYRGIHDVYEYDVRSYAGQHLKGLYIEIQYRTKIQHAWATAVEVVGYITESQPKFVRGDQRYHQMMAYASEILARAFEDNHGPFPEVSDTELVKNFLELDEQLSLLQTLKGLNTADQAVSQNKNSILIFSPNGELEVKTYRDAPEAIRALFQMEKSMPDKDIVLVRAETNDDVRYAFKNYFSDAREFIDFINQGLNFLATR